MQNTDSNDKDGNAITVFHVRNSNYAGGIETTLYGWFKYADRVKFNPRLLIFRERRKLHERSRELFLKHGISCELLPWGYSRNLPYAVYRLYQKVKAATNPILHSHDTRSDLVALIVARITGVPLVISNHAWHPADMKRRILEAIRARLMKGADVIISVSEDTHRETLEKQIPPDKCMAMYSGIDLEPYRNIPSRQQARRQLGIPEDCYLVGNIARLWPEKEQDKIIEAASQLAPRFPQMRFAIIGDGPLEEHLKNRIRELGMEQVVLMPGFLEDYVQAFAALDCFAFPSSAEGTPMVIYSAMAMNVPIVASAISGVGEILEDEHSALLIPPADVDALAHSIERLVSQPDLAAALAKAAKEDVESKFSAEIAVSKLESIYTGLLNNRKVKGVE